MTRVMLVDDDRLVRAGLAAILASTDDIQVVAEAEDGGRCLALLQQHRVDVVLMDVRMPRVDGLAATRQVTRLPQPPAVLMLTTFDLDDYVFRALEAGASGFLLKDTPPEDIIDAVRVVAGGEAMLSPSVTRRLISHFALRSGDGRRRSALARLEVVTGRERDVLVEVGRGRSNAAVARVLFLSEATVKAHVSRLLGKLELDNRVQLAILCHDAGLDDG